MEQTLQELLIDIIGFLETVPGQEERLQAWRDHLDRVNTFTDPPKCPTGYVWDNVLQKCVFNG